MEKKPSDWRESLWRRPLTAAERAALGAQPDAAADAAELELETRLTESLSKIPDVRVSSNFTARVLSAIELEATREERRRTFHWNWRGFLPRTLATAAIMVFAGLLWQRHEVTSQRSLLARDVAKVTSAQPPPSVDVLNNFDAIQRMSQPVDADKELLALMQ